MELSKKAAYLKGLMEGLKIDETTPEGQVLKVIADILSDMADEVEENGFALNAISEYIDVLEDGSDPLDEIDTYEYGFDPVTGEPAEGAADSGNSSPADESASGGIGEDGEYDESIRFSEFLGHIVSDHDYTDDPNIDGGSAKLIETLKNMVVKGYEEQELEEKKQRTEGLPVSSHVLNDEERHDFISKLEDLLSSVSDEEDEEEENGLDTVLGRMRCPFCHRDLTIKVSDIAEKIVSCPCCGNKLTIML